MFIGMLVLVIVENKLPNKNTQVYEGFGPNPDLTIANYFSKLWPELGAA